MVTKLDAELAIRDGDDHAFYHQFNGIESLFTFKLIFSLKKTQICGVSTAIHKGLLPLLFIIYRFVAVNELFFDDFN